MAMGLLALPSTAGHHVLSFPSFAPKITFPCKSRNLSVALQVQAAIVEATPRSPPPVRKITAGNDAVPVSSLRSSRDRAGDMQAEAGAMARAANASVYSPELLAIEYGSHPIKVLQRTLEIFIGLGTFAFKLWVDQFNGQLDRNRRIRAIQLRKVFTKLGPTFVKIGQGLSTRPDLCPPEYLEELSELQVFPLSIPSFN